MIQTTTRPYVHTCTLTQQLCFFAYVTREEDRQTHFSLQITDSIVTDYWLGNGNIKTTRNFFHELPQNKRSVQGSVLKKLFLCLEHMPRVSRISETLVQK